MMVMMVTMQVVPNKPIVDGHEKSQMEHHHDAYEGHDDNEHHQGSQQELWK